MTVKTSHILRVHQFRLDMFVSGPSLHPVTRLTYERMYWTPLADYLADLLADECALDLGIDAAEVVASLAAAGRAAGRDPQAIDGNTPLGDIVALAQTLGLPLRLVRAARSSATPRSTVIPPQVDRAMRQPVKASHFLHAHQHRLDVFQHSSHRHPFSFERMYWTPLADYLADLLADECALNLGIDPAEVVTSLAAAERAAGRDPQLLDGNALLGDIVALARTLRLQLRVVRTARWIAASSYAQRNPEVITRLAEAIPQTDARSRIACIDECDVDPAIYDGEVGRTPSKWADTRRAGYRVILDGAR